MRGLLFFTSVWLATWVAAGWSRAADPAFVGVISLIADDSVVQQLKLDVRTRDKLLKVIEDRESEALELALQIKNLPADEQRAKLLPFVAESEKQGFALLTAAQQTQLQQIRIARGGLLTLRESGVAETLALTPGQREQVEKHFAELDAKLRSGTADERRIAKAETERQLAGLLNKEQRAAWEKLAGQVPVEAVAVNDQAPPPPVEEKTPAVIPPAPQPATTPAVAAPETSTPPAKPTTLVGDNAKLKFGFRFTPWKDVLDWFATQADLSLVLDAPPPGTFNYSDSRSYTPAEAIDLLNSVLLTKGYTLVRRGRMLLVINLEDGIPPNLVPQVSVDDLDAKGEYELVSCLFPLGKFAPEDADKEIRPLLGPQGALLVLPKAKQIYVTETAGKLRTIRRILQQIEPPTGLDDKIAAFKLKHILPSELMTIARPLLGIPEGINSTPDGSLRISIDEINGRMLLTGKPERVQKMNDLITMLDVEPDASALPLTAIESPQLEVYSVTTADPDTVVQVLRTLLGGFPDVRLDKDAKTGNIVAYARPAQHGTIKATIEQMQKDPRQVEVIKLRKLDPSVAVLAINKMFGGGEEGASTSGPKVDADPTSLQLIIRGSQSQVEQIRELLGKMGETSLDEKSPLAERSNLRTIPLTGRAANSALEQVQALWPTVHSNKIRTVTPSKSSSLRVPLPPAGKEQSPPAEQPNIVPPLLDSLKLKKSAQTQTGIEARFVAFQQPAPTSPATAPSAGTGTAPSNAEKPKTPAEKPAVETPPPQKTVPGAEIVITVGPGGLIIASEDLDALDALEEMLLQVASQTEASGKEYAVFYLRFAKAEAAVEILQQAMGGGGGSSDAGGGGSLMGDLASSFLGGQGGLLGGLMGGLGGGSGGATSSGPVSMTPDPRLNAILCYGRANDLDLVEQMLKVVDQESSPEDVLTNGRPRFIAVVNADAEEIGTVVKQIYSARIAADSNQQRQPSPEEFIRALRGGGGGRGGSSGAKKSEEQKMTIGIDKRSNSLIVSAPDPLFQEVRLLVEQLDVASTSKDEAVSVVSIKRANPELVERALNSLVGNNATVTRQGGASTKSSSASKTSGTSESRQPTPEQIQDDIRRRVETFNALQQEMSRGRSSSGGATPPRRGN